MELFPKKSNADVAKKAVAKHNKASRKIQKITITRIAPEMHNCPSCGVRHTKKKAKR